MLAALADDVIWANAMEGGHVHGPEAVRAYWNRPFSVVSVFVEPVGFAEAADGSLVVTVRQTVRDPEGNPLQDQAHGLHDKLVEHAFRFEGSKIVRFDVQDAQ